MSLLYRGGGRGRGNALTGVKFGLRPPLLIVLETGEYTEPIHTHPASAIPARAVASGLDVRDRERRDDRHCGASALVFSGIVSIPFGNSFSVAVKYAEVGLCSLA